MGGPPIAFPTPNFLILTTLRKLAFYAPLPHFENPCLLELPIVASSGEEEIDTRAKIGLVPQLPLWLRLQLRFLLRRRLRVFV